MDRDKKKVGTKAIGSFLGLSRFRLDLDGGDLRVEAIKHTERSSVGFPS
jgi:hypothetical protein